MCAPCRSNAPKLCGPRPKSIQGGDFLSVTPAKATKKRLPESSPSPLAAMADELGALEKEYALAMAPLELKLPRMKALKEALQAACPAPADKEWIVEGEKFGVKLGPRANQRLINIVALVKKIGPAAFAKFATTTLGELEKNVSPDVAKAFVSTDQIGPRKLSTFEKGIV